MLEILLYRRVLMVLKEHGLYLTWYFDMQNMANV
jgi:hypothetical protein